MSGLQTQLSAFWNSAAFDAVFFDNSVRSYLVALIAFAALLIALHLVQIVVFHRLKALAGKTKTYIDDLAIAVIESVRPPFYFYLALYLALHTLSLHAFIDKGANAILIIWLVYQAVVAVQIIIGKIAEHELKDERGSSGRTAINAIGKLSKIVLWTVGLLFILSNLGVDITSLIAGLGIGGVAIALALQNILSDLFSYFAINFDKPFVIGDFIIVGDKMGVVEKIGIKTTRIRALQGEEIVFSNNELTSAKIQNFKKMRERRVVFAFGVTYGTPTEKLRKIPGTVRGIVESAGGTRFDRCHFHEFGDSSLNIETVYYVATGDYNAYMDVHQLIHLKIKEAMEQEGIEFAFPTRTVHLAKE